MSYLIAQTRARALVALAVALTVAFGTSLYGAAPAQAGANSRTGHCIDSYNYADPANDYLFASTTGKHAFPEPCGWVQVWIRNGGCSGTDVAYNQGIWYTSVSVVGPSQWWASPCSYHMGEWHIEVHGLPFLY